MKLPFKPREMDIFFTSGRDPVSCFLNRTAGAGFKNAFNYSIPTHTGFMTVDHDQWFATELTEDGIEEDSFEKYLTERRFKSRLHSVYRWEGFNWYDVRDRAIERLVRLRQQDSGYDWFGAIATHKLTRFLFPWMKQNKKKDFCSENVFKILKKFGLEGYPPKWIIEPPHPHRLHEFIRRDKNFLLIYENY